MLVRAATAADLPALVEIYNHYVVETPITFDVEPATVEARRAWLAGFDPDGPHRLLVGDEDGTVVGYACSTRHRPKAAYDRSIETTIYLAPDATGRGLGRALYGELLAQLEAHPAAHRAFAGITQPNPASDALHRSLGFSELGLFREVGFKFGRYWDTRWYERPLEP